MQWQLYIERNPEILGGKPVIKGTRIRVELIMRKLGGGNSPDDILKAYPHLTREQIAAACEFATDVISNEETVLN